MVCFDSDLGALEGGEGVEFEGGVIAVAFWGVVWGLEVNLGKGSVSGFYIEGGVSFNRRAGSC